jgi:serine/threonine protein kinase
MTDGLIIFINDDAVSVNELFLNEEWKIEELYKNIFTVSIGNVELEWLVKTYPKQSHAKKEMDNLEKLKKIEGVPKILASGHTKRFSYNMISKVNARDLYETIDEQGTMSEKEIRLIASQLLNILKQVHLYGIIHGDIKPENIMYDRKNKKVTLIDFEDKFTDDYRSPEQIVEKRLTPKSDLWSIGIVLFFLKTKRIPFKGEREILTKRIKFPLRFSTEFKDFLSLLLERDIRRRLSIDEALNHGWLVNEL